MKIRPPSSIFSITTIILYLLTLHPEYLSQVSLDAMIEIGNDIRREESDFTNVREFSRLLDKYFYPHDQPWYFTMFDSLFSPLQHALQRNSAKELKTVDDITLEIKLLQYNLHDIPTLPAEQLKTLGDFMGELTTQMQMYWCGDGVYRKDHQRRLFA